MPLDYEIGIVFLSRALQTVSIKYNSLFNYREPFSYDRGIDGPNLTARKVGDVCVMQTSG